MALNDLQTVFVTLKVLGAGNERGGAGSYLLAAPGPPYHPVRQLFGV